VCVCVALAHTNY